MIKLDYPKPLLEEVEVALLKQQPKLRQGIPSVVRASFRQAMVDLIVKSSLGIDVRIFSLKGKRMFDPQQVEEKLPILANKMFEALDGVGFYCGSVEPEKNEAILITS